MREVVIDTETTGLSFKSGDRVVEVGCVELINHVATNNSLQFYCKVDRKMSEGALRTTGITDKFLSDKKKFSDYCDKFLKFIKHKIDLHYVSIYNKCNVFISRVLKRGLNQAIFIF